MNAFPYPIRTECPPGACNCGRDVLLQSPASEAELRIMRLTREEEKRLLQRLESLRSLEDLRHLEELLQTQLGITLTITLSPNEVKTLRGIAILVNEQAGLCKKTRQAIPQAIKKSMEQHPEIAFEMLNEGGLFA